MRRIIKMAALLLLSTLPLPGLAENLVENSGFEAGIQGWSGFGGAYIDSTWGGDGAVGVVSNMDSPSAGIYQSLTGKVSRGDGIQFGARVQFVDGGAQGTVRLRLRRMDRNGEQLITLAETSANGWDSNQWLWATWSVWHVGSLSEIGVFVQCEESGGSIPGNQGCIVDDFTADRTINGNTRNSANYILDNSQFFDGLQRWSAEGSSYLDTTWVGEQQAALVAGIGDEYSGLYQAVTDKVSQGNQLNLKALVSLADGAAVGNAQIKIKRVDGAGISYITVASNEVNGWSQNWLQGSWTVDYTGTLLELGVLVTAQEQSGTDGNHGLIALNVAASNGSQQWTVTFEDEFEGSSLNTDKWNNGYLRWGSRTQNPRNQEQQVYKESNVTVGSGLLQITGKKQSSLWYLDWTGWGNWSNRNFDYTSGMITSFGKFSQTYGRFEVLAKIPAGQGLWPAFWLLSDDGDRSEIDIFEILGHEPGTAYFNYTRPVDWANYPGVAKLPDLSTGFHQYVLEWEPGTLRYYIDNQLVHEVARENWEIKDRSMYILLNLAIGGQWPGSPDASTPFPAGFLVDYVRVYESNSAPYSKPGITDQTFSAELDWQDVSVDSSSGNRNIAVIVKCASNLDYDDKCASDSRVLGVSLVDGHRNTIDTQYFSSETWIQDTNGNAIPNLYTSYFQINPASLAVSPPYYIEVGVYHRGGISIHWQDALHHQSGLGTIPLP